MPESPVITRRLSIADYLKTDVLFVQLFAGIGLGIMALSLVAQFGPGPTPPEWLPVMIVLWPFGIVGLAAYGVRRRLARIARAVDRGDVLLTTARVEGNSFVMTIMPDAESFLDRMPALHFANRRLRGLKTGDPIAVVRLGRWLLPEKVVLEALLDPEELEAVRARVEATR